MRIIQRLGLAACLVSAPVPLRAQQPPDSTGYAVAGTDSAAVARFISTLQRAAAANDSLTIARLIDYRHVIGLWDGRRYVSYATQAGFLRAYHRIFDRALREAIAAVTPDSLFANYQGVMFNNGRVWAYPNDAGQLLMITINQPMQPRRPHAPGSKRVGARRHR